MKHLTLIIAVLLAGCAQPYKVKSAPGTTTMCVDHRHTGETYTTCETVPRVDVKPLPDKRCAIEHQFAVVGIVSGPMYDDIVPDFCKQMRVEQQIEDEK